MTGDVRQYDLIIIGGGINGAGIARDAAMRGIRTLLLEAHDFGSGTSSWSSRLIHGGLRYLEYGELPLVYESLHERRHLQVIAPHLVKRIRITIPIYKGSKRGRTIVRLGMMAYDLLSLGKNLPRHRMLSRQELIDAEPGINSDGLRGGAQYYDAQVTYAERLVLENVIAAAEAGATVKNYSPVTGIRFRDDGYHRIHYRPAESEDDAVVTAPVVVNAAGPWVDRVLALGNAEMRRLMGGTKGSHIVVAPFRGAPKDAVYVEANADGRPIFIIPWNKQYLIGTTDIRVNIDPADVQASDEEIRYLVDETNRVFPQAKLKPEGIDFAYAGVRPLPYRKKGPESAVTRKHIIKKHRGRARGLISIIGGKLTTYRNLARQTVDKVQKMAGNHPSACRTADVPLPGATDSEAAEETLASIDSLSAEGRHRIAMIYGGRVRRLQEIVAAQPELGAALDAEGTVLAAEIALAVRDEFALCLSDIVHRRLMVGLSANLGAHLTLSIAAAAASELGWSSKEAERQLGILNAHNARLRRTDSS
ncbi:MAG: glycerol-3-phosphate dehydrogenase [Gammaproteobacteria bacterium]|nr:glycerol-3-phosphate dehydrogenase [Gammaproteobacteria bacterium]